LAPFSVDVKGGVFWRSFFPSMTKEESVGNLGMTVYGVFIDVNPL
jgi:hypothetical protein